MLPSWAHFREETCSCVWLSRDCLETSKLCKKYIYVSALNRTIGECQTAARSLRTHFTIPPKKNRKLDRRTAVRRTESSERRGTRRRVRAKEDELVRRRVGYALLCKKNDHRVVKGSEIAESRSEEKVHERRRRFMLHRERQMSRVWSEGMCGEGKARHVRIG